MSTRFFAVSGEVFVDNPAGQAVGAFFTDSIMRYLGDMEELLEVHSIQDILKHHNIPIQSNLNTLWDLTDMIYEQVEMSFALGSVNVDKLEKDFFRLQSIRNILESQIMEIRRLAYKKVHDDEAEEAIVEDWTELGRLLLIAMELYAPGLNRAIMQGYEDFVEEHGESLGGAHE